MIFSNEIQSLAKKLVTEIFTDLVFVNPKQQNIQLKNGKKSGYNGN